ncbi:hypothetical protein GX917_02630 [Candidatus Falkowbacteria bacterium]|jgi:formate hydrogenlyase subunit 3/multisubunit Na+/H+ antiporter MnhD subunit|nr:hypothetical protein [Candidatus Falkowbacteria bacterium]
MSYSSFYARFYSILENIKQSFSAIFRLTASRIYLALMVFWQVLAWLQAWFIYRSLSTELVILHYNINFGIDLVADRAQIYLYPLLGLVVSLVNLIILASLRKDNNFKIFVHYFLGAANVFGAFLCIALLSVYLINFR